MATSNTSCDKIHNGIMTCPFLSLGCNYEAFDSADADEHVKSNYTKHLSMLRDVVTDMLNRMRSLEVTSSNGMEKITKDRSLEGNSDAPQLSDVNVHHMSMAQLNEFQTYDARIRLVEDNINEIRSEDAKEAIIKDILVKMGCDEMILERNQMFTQSTDCIMSKENKCNSLKMDQFVREEIDRIISVKLQTLNEEIGQLKASITLLPTMITQLEILKDMQVTSSHEMWEKTEKLNEKFDELQLSLVDVKWELINLNCGEFVWKIQNLSHVRNCKNIESPSFYSHLNGYLICLRLNWSLCDPSCVRIGFAIKQGPFDDILEWPFKHCVVISIARQDTGDDCFKSKMQLRDSQKKHRNCFEKPRTGFSCGINNCVMLKWNILTRSYSIYWNDCIFVRCRVGNPV